MSRGGGGGGAAGGWTWWPPSRRRQQQQPGSRREAALGGEGPAELGWALCAAAALLLLLLLLLWLLGAAAALGLCGAGLFLAAGAAWAADLAGAPHAARRSAPQRLGPRRGAPSPRERPLPGESAVANGGPGLLALRENKSGGRPRFLGGNHLALPAHFVLPLRRRYPIHQAQYASLGTLPSICWDGYRQKNRLSTRNSGLVQSPVTVKIARPDNSFGRSPLLEQLSSPGSFSPAPHDDTPDLCAREAVLSALKQSRKRAMMEEEEEEEEEEENHPQNLLSGQESKRRRHGSSGSGQSVFEPLVANGVPASLVPKPGSLKRGLLSHGLEDSASKRSRFSSLSSTSSLCVGGIPSSLRNAIASSYSSSRGLSQLWKRSGQSASPFSSPASSRSQTPERPSKKARSLDASLTEEEAPHAGVSTPVEADQEVPAEQTAETPVARHRVLGSPSSSGSNRKRRRKIQLLSTRRADRFALPPPPQLGYSATSEDLDADKKVTLQRFNKVLEEKADSTPDPPVETTSVPSALSFPLLAAPSAVLAPGTNPLLESLRKMQGEQSCPAQADAAAAAEAPRPLTPAASLDLSSSAPVTTPEAKPLALAVPVSLAVAAPSPADVEPAGSASSLAAMSESGPVLARPSSVPQPSLLGLLVSPAAGQPAAAVTAASSLPSAMPVLKPVFGSLAKPEGPASASRSGAPGTAASGPAPPGVGPTLGAACGPPSSTFKPIFGAPPPATTALPSAAAAAATASLFTFKQSPQLAPACSLPSSAPPSGASGLPGLLEAIVAPAASSSATPSATPASASKPPVFSFGLGVPAVPSSTTAATTTTTTTAASAAQPFLFGALPSSTTAPGTATAPVFQFGKAAAVAAAPESTLNPFSQVPPSSSSSSTAAGPAPPTAASFSVFGSGAPASAATTQQPAVPLTFGSCPSAFSAAFGSPLKPPPPYRAGTSQLTLEAGAPDGQQPATKPGPGAPMSFGAPFSFAGSVAQPAAQSVFGGSASGGGSSQAPFGGSGPLASFGTKSTAQPAFGAATSSVFSFGTAATTSAASGFGANTQTTSSGAGGSSVFGSGGSGPSSFSFGASGQPAAAGSSAFGPRAAGGGSVGGPAVGFSFGSGQGAAAGAAAPPFGSPLAQPPLGSQSPFAFSIPGATPEGKPAFGGAPTPTFGQGLPAPGGGTAGSPLSFGAPLTPAFGGAGSTFGPATPSFSIGAGSKMGGRQRLQARRHTARKK